MNKGKRLVLTGFMGVGKSSVGRHLAQILHAERIDLDFFIEKNEKRKISDIIDVDGEAAYRTIESANLRKLLDEHEGVPIPSAGQNSSDLHDHAIPRKQGLTRIWLESPFKH